ncbi:hypothetical protein D9M68_803300 [compost metagenome]
MARQLVSIDAQAKASQQHEAEEGQPQAVVAKTLQQPGQRQAQGDRQEHGIAHFAGAGCPDEQAVEQIAPHRQ